MIRSLSNTGSIPVSPTIYRPRKCWARRPCEQKSAAPRGSSFPHHSHAGGVLARTTFRSYGDHCRSGHRLFASRRHISSVTAEPLAPALLTIEDACSYLDGAKKSYIYHLVYQGRLRSTRVGRELRFRPEWLECFLEAEADRRAELQRERVARAKRRTEDVNPHRVVRRRERVTESDTVPASRWNVDW